MSNLMDTLLGEPAGDIRTALRRDHEQLLELAEALCEGSGGENRRRRFAQFRELLSAHSLSEEVVVYRALQRLKEAESREIALEGTVEHGSVDALVSKLARMRDLDSASAAAHLKVVKEMLEHHIEEEHNELFDQLQQHFDDEQRTAMGERFEQTKSSPPPRRRKTRTRAAVAA